MELEFLFWFLVVALFAYETLALGNHREGDTISEIIWRISKRPLVPFGFGFLMGHFFW